MGKEPALYQLMGICMNNITNSDREYREIIRKSDEYSSSLDSLNLPKKVRLLIHRYVSKQNAVNSLYGMLAYLLGFSDRKEILMEKCLFTGPQQMCKKVKNHEKWLEIQALFFIPSLVVKP